MSLSSLRRCALAALLGSALGDGGAPPQDSMALLQQSIAPHADMSATLARLMEENKGLLAMGPEFAEMMTDLAHSNYLAGTVAAGKKFNAAFKDSMEKGWNKFFRMNHKSSNPNPHALLDSAKTALLETGAMQQMRQMAVSTMNASRSAVQGAVPLDSMMVGFRTSVAPWNNVLKMFAMPLVKASFTIFTNFFGPDGNAARLCIGAQVAADSTYGTHTRSEFGGVNIWIGPAKWDNVPGWSFGSSGGLDDIKVFDVADFGWTWTLAREPETVCFFYDICIVDSETLHAGMLQTGSEIQETSEVAEVAKHGSTWMQHIWCSPDWDNTPLVIPDDAPVSSDQGAEAGAHAQTGGYFKASSEEEWDPESDAV